MIEAIERYDLAGKGLSVFNHNLCCPRHRWYPFKEGFSDRLVRLAIEDAAGHGHQLRILDPFAGSGTTLVTAGALNHSATGIEVNPFLGFTAKAKCAPGGSDQTAFKNTLDSVMASSRHEVPSPLEGRSTFTESPSAKQWLFNRSVIRGFTAIDIALQETGQCRDPLRLALFAALMDCCNAKRDGKCLRYRKGWGELGLDSNDLRSAFLRRAQTVGEDMADDAFKAEGLDIIEGDARQVLKALESKKFDLLVTSPPYLNSLDYSDVYRPELFAGGFVKDNAELRLVRLKTMRSHVQVAWEPTSQTSSSMIKPILDELDARKLWDSRLPSMVQAYFDDIATVLREAARLVKERCRAWVVVSTSAYAGVHVPVDLILADIAVQVGWRLDGVYVLRYLRTSGQNWQKLGVGSRMPLRESLVALRR